MSIQADKKRVEFDYNVDQDVYDACSQIGDIHNLKSFAATLRFLVNQYWYFTEAGGLFCSSCDAPLKLYCVACGEIKIIKQITGSKQLNAQGSGSTSPSQNARNAQSNGTLLSGLKEELEIPVQNFTNSNQHGTSDSAKSGTAQSVEISNCDEKHDDSTRRHDWSDIEAAGDDTGVGLSDCESPAAEQDEDIQNVSESVCGKLGDRVSPTVVISLPNETTEFPATRQEGPSVSTRSKTSGQRKVATRKSERQLNKRQRADSEDWCLTDSLSHGSASGEDEKESKRKTSANAKTKTKRKKAKDEDWYPSGSLVPCSGSDEDEEEGETSKKLSNSETKSKQTPTKRRRKEMSVCEICFESFISLVLLQEHKEKHDATESFQCDLCECDAFSEIGAYTQHRREHKESMQFKCGRCCWHFASLESLNKHVLVHGPISMSKNCQYCGKVYKKLTHLRRHLPTHTGERPFVCEICGKGFGHKPSFRQHLKLHVINADKDRQGYMCEHCGAVFQDRYELTLHSKHHHNDRPAKCKICKEVYNTKWQLYKHKRIHRPEIRPVCPLCQKTFSSKSKLKDHLRRHNKEKLHKCATCGAAFVTTAELTMHTKRHSDFRPYQCEWCPYAARCHDDLKSHVRTHTGEKPYECKLCGRCFARRDYLKKHGKTHYGVAPPIP